MVEYSVLNHFSDVTVITAEELYPLFKTTDTIPTCQNISCVKFEMVFNQS